MVFVESKRLHIETYLHQLLPTVITCAVGSGVCRNSTFKEQKDIREFAARIIDIVAKNYCMEAGKANNVYSRLVRTFVSALEDPTKSLLSVYGVLLCLNKLGPQACGVSIPAMEKAVIRAREAEDKTVMREIENTSQVNYFMYIDTVVKSLAASGKNPAAVLREDKVFMDNYEIGISLFTESVVRSHINVPTMPI